MRLSTNEVLILSVLQKTKKAVERRILIEKTGISDKNISAKLNSLEVKGLISSERTRKERTVNRWLQTTKAGRDYELGKIVITKKPTKIPIKLPQKPRKAITKAKIEKAKKPKYESKLEYLEAQRKEKIEMKPLPATIEFKKELRLLINLVLTHRKEEYAKYGYKSVSEIRAEIDTIIDKLGS